MSLPCSYTMMVHPCWLFFLLILADSLALSSRTVPTTRTDTAPPPLFITTTTPSPLYTQTSTPRTFPVHTLLLCRHGDSIWNGGEPGCRETFTGWSDVPLSPKGIREAKATGEQLSALFNQEIDVCCTSILNRAQMTAHYCLWGFSEKPSHLAPRQYVTDYRLNERHYGALQGLVKADVEAGMYGHDPALVQSWRRGWHAVPPLLEEEDPRRLEEIKRYRNFCDGPVNVPRGESLAMVARDRIQPFLDDRLTPVLNQSAERRGQEGQGGTGLVVAHANSLRALIGVLCRVEENPSALKKLEAMKIPTGVPMMVQYQETEVPGRYRALPADPTTTNSLQYLPSSILPEE